MPFGTSARQPWRTPAARPWRRTWRGWPPSPCGCPPSGSSPFPGWSAGRGAPARWGTIRDCEGGIGVGGASLSEYSWRSSARAVLAIARKDCLHFVRYPLNAFFRMFEPLIWLTPVYFLGKSFATPRGNSGFAAYAGTGDYMSFILLGTVLSNYVAAVFWGMGFALKNEMDAGVLETNWMAPLPRPGDEIALLLVFMGAMVPLGFAVCKRIERRCRVLGTLGSH